jgi:hypothetical protein
MEQPMLTQQGNISSNVKHTREGDEKNSFLTFHSIAKQHSKKFGLCFSPNVVQW